MTVKFMKTNRLHKHKDKKSSGCGLCKPHKHGGRAIKDQERLHLEAGNKDLKDMMAHFDSAFKQEKKYGPNKSILRP